MENKFYRHIETGEVTSALEEGLASYKRIYEEQVREGHISKDEPFIAPPEMDMIEQGIILLEENEDYEEVEQ